eukprot:3267432-Pyramimonas_sp.AAC.1
MGYTKEDHSHAICYIFANWVSHEIFGERLEDILKFPVPVEIGKSPHACASGSGAEEFWTRVSRRSEKKAGPIADLMARVLRRNVRCHGCGGSGVHSR